MLIHWIWVLLATVVMAYVGSRSNNRTVMRNFVICVVIYAAGLILIHTLQGQKASPQYFIAEEFYHCLNMAKDDNQLVSCLDEYADDFTPEEYAEFKGIVLDKEVHWSEILKPVAN